ncbi:MAG TPA: electron transfer flavoprotein subunit alpha, partial [Thermoplasmata archaeon]|nr:electron transfer flavoprotein subunit alpha [Thermoplasmata archaeon]
MSANVLVLAEHREGKVAGTTYELIVKGRELAARIGGNMSMQVVLLGKGVGNLAGEVASRGDHVLYAEHDALAA